MRDVHFFVGGLSNEIDPNTLGAYIKNSTGITPVEVTLNRRNSFNSTYKVTVKSNEKDKLFCADAWEENIIVKPFRERRNRDQQRQPRYNENENEAPKNQTPIDWEGINQRLYDATLSPNGRRIFY